MDFIKDMDTKILYKRYENIANRMYYGLVEKTKFLNPYEAKILISIFNRESFYYQIFKSHTHAERVIIYFSTDPFHLSDYIDEDLAVLEIENTNGDIKHPDVLGSLMSLGLERENIGEIIITEDKIEVSLLNEISDYIFFNLKKIKNYRVKIKYKDGIYLDSSNLDLEKKHIIASSMRLDVIISSIFNLSRSKSKKIIQSEQVKVNHVVENNPSIELDKDDIIVVRRYGKFKIGNVLGKTRKDKHRLDVYVFK